MRRMDNRGDFIQRLGLDISINILNQLDEPSDLVHACAVSRSWSRFALLEIVSELSSVTHVIEVENLIEPVKVSAGGSPEWERLRRDNRVYAFIAQGLTPWIKEDCIIEPISASSTDNYPDESIQNTLEPKDRIELRASYWSSKGESDPNVPEILTYKLVAQLCVVTEIQVQPFQAYFQYGFPIYSSRAVRFRLGYSRHPLEFDDDIREDMLIHHRWSDDDFIWTYTSPEFPVAQVSCTVAYIVCTVAYIVQSERWRNLRPVCFNANIAIEPLTCAYIHGFSLENELQKFKLPEAVLCIGGILQVELLGRVQKQEIDGLYYICVSHVQVVGRPLSSPFDIDMLDSSGKCTLKYNPKTLCCHSSTQLPEGEADTPSRLRTFTTRLLQLLGNGPVGFFSTGFLKRV
ncbi:f-box protein [Quercus suber]|uniref:F-box protein n=1 Tax=Quercus suber TaxID=58331 RepID=A0AAW0L5R0_QUESU